MFNNFILSVIKNVGNFLLENPKFFGENADKKETQLEEAQIPSFIRPYLMNTSEEDFMKDLKIVLSFLQKSKTTNYEDNKLLQAITNFLTKALAKQLDSLNQDYYLLNQENRQQIVQKLIPSETETAETLRKILTNHTYQQVAGAIQKLTFAVNKAPSVLVQSPREIKPELRKEIREKLSKDQENSMPIFQINHKLIGGLRIFVDGKSQDYSWLSRVHRFTNLTKN